MYCYPYLCCHEGIQRVQLVLVSLTAALGRQWQGSVRRNGVGLVHHHGHWRGRMLSTGYTSRLLQLPRLELGQASRFFLCITARRSATCALVLVLGWCRSSKLTPIRLFITVFFPA